MTVCGAQTGQIGTRCYFVASAAKCDHRSEGKPIGVDRHPDPFHCPLGARAQPLSPGSHPSSPNSRALLTIACYRLSPYRGWRPGRNGEALEHSRDIRTCAGRHRAWKMRKIRSVASHSSHRSGLSSPKVQIIHGALLVSHVNVEGEKIDRRQSTATEDLKKRRQAIALLHVGERVVRSHCESCGCLPVENPAPKIQK